MPCQTDSITCHRKSLAATVLQNLVQRTARAIGVAQLQRADKNLSRARCANSSHAVNAFGGVICVRSGHVPRVTGAAAAVEPALRLTAKRERRLEAGVDKSPTEPRLTRVFSVACRPRTPTGADRAANQRTQGDAPHKLGSLA